MDPEHLVKAMALLGTDNVSVLLDTALVALIERELERRWLVAHHDQDPPGDVRGDPSDLPWDDE